MHAIAVDVGQLELAAQVLDRQADHCAATSRYLAEQCTIPAWDLGLLLQFLHPVNELVVNLAGDMEQALGRVATAGADATRGAAGDYVRMEDWAGEAVRSLVTQLGGGVSSGAGAAGGADAGRPVLGPALESAPPGFATEPFAGHPLEDLVVNVVDLGERAVGLVADGVRAAGDRASLYGATGVVSERTDASSYLMPMAAEQENWVEEVRSKAGVIIGGVDWVAEQFLGISILEEYVLKPFAGDWHALGRASRSWSAAGTAMQSCAGNVAALPGQLTSWSGQGATAFHAGMTGLSGGLLAASRGLECVSGVVDKVATVAKLAAGGIATLLRKIANKLLRMAAEAAVPVVGWVAFAAEAAIMIGEIISWLGLITSLIGMIVDAISEAIAARETLMEVILVVEDLVRGGGGLVARNAGL